MIVVYGETLWSPAPQPMDDDDEFCVFTAKSPSVTQRSVSQENAFKKSKTRRLFFFRKIIGSNSSFTLIENNFRFLR